MCVLLNNCNVNTKGANSSTTISIRYLQINIYTLITEMPVSTKNKQKQCYYIIVKFYYLITEIKVDDFDQVHHKLLMKKVYLVICSCLKILLLEIFPSRSVAEIF